MSNVALADDFSISLLKDYKELEEDAQKNTTDVIFKMFQEIVTDTPVDTGNAAANWNLSFDEPDTKWDKRLKNGDRKILKAAIQLKNKDFSQLGTVYITNNVVYIRRLEEGHSKKAPAGFVKAAVERARRRL